MTQEDVGALAGVTQARVGEYERGVYACTVDILERLAGAFDVPVAELFDESTFEVSPKPKRTAKR